MPITLQSSASPGRPVKRIVESQTGFKLGGFPVEGPLEGQKGHGSAFFWRVSQQGRKLPSNRRVPMGKEDTQSIASL